MGGKTKPEPVGTRGQKGQGQMLGRARCEPDLSTERVSLPPYEAGDSTDGYTDSYENFGDQGPPYNVVSKTAFNCTDNYQL